MSSLPSVTKTLNITCMNKTFYILILFFILACNQKQKQQNPVAEVRLNQIGYYPNSIKRAIVVNTRADQFEVKTENGETVFSGKLSDEKYWDKSGEKIKIADFSDFKQKGKYFLYVNDLKDTLFFEIKDNLYADAFKVALKSYYLIRASMDIEKQYAGKYQRKGGHPDTVCYYHPSSGIKTGYMSSPGGWYDAGDYNKYIVNGGVTVGTLLNTYEMFPGLVGDNFSNIPESGNGKSDLLDEIKYELDWVLTMQAPDGSSYFKLSSKQFSGFVMPDKDKLKRYVIGKSTASTLNFAAMTAMAARIYKDYDSKFAEKCAIAAEKAWKWAVKNPDIVFLNPEDVLTGQYSDTDFSQEFWWAASELFLLNEKDEYKNYLLANTPYLTFEVSESWRLFLGNIGSFSLLLNSDKIPGNLNKKLTGQLVKTADDLLDKINTIPYRIPIDEFVWGSNSDIQNAAIILIYAYKLTSQQKYFDGVIETMDYIFGKNATAYSFMSGFGTKQIAHPHNRISGSDGIAQPLPGLIAGGPNKNREDDISKTKFGVAYPDTLPAKCFVDHEKSYASNETAINWNAPAVFVLAFFQANNKNLN